MKLSDIMYQALKVKKYKIFDKALVERKALLEQMKADSISFDTLSDQLKAEYRNKIEESDKKIESAMATYKSEVENELADVHSKKAKLRKQSSVKHYYQKDTGGRGVFINKLK